MNRARIGTERILDQVGRSGVIPSKMRVRITRSLSGSIDGIQLDRFIPGFVYDVGTSIGSYLLSEGWAVPVVDESPALVVPLHAPMFHPYRLSRFRRPKLPTWRAASARARTADRDPIRRNRSNKNGGD